MYPCICYHFSIDIFLIMIFRVATSLSIFSSTRPFLAQCRKQVNVIMYSSMLIETISPSVLGTMLSPVWSVLLISCSFISFIFSLVFLTFHTSVNIFLLYFFKHTGWNTLVCLIISLRENQSATHGMLQKEIKNGFRKPA